MLNRLISAKRQLNRRQFDKDEINKEIKLRKAVTFTAVALLIVALLSLSVLFFKNENYILLSFIVLFFAMLPFFALYEIKKPRARDLVLISTMTAFTVGANVICTHTIPIHAGTALVVISGITLGPEAGFLTGALSRLLCNVFDGQGPWTPWQMVAWGIIGLISGISFNRINVNAKSIFNEAVQKKSNSFKVILGPIICVLLTEVVGVIISILQGDLKDFPGIKVYIFGFTGLVIGVIIQRAKLPTDAITTSVFTFLTTLIIYGGLMNLANMFMLTYMDPSNPEMSWDSLKAVFVTGLLYDLTHALGAAACIFVFGESMIMKIERIKIKYGIFV